MIGSVLTRRNRINGDLKKQLDPELANHPFALTMKNGTEVENCSLRIVVSSSWSGSPLCPA
jgi:hypothetical protein